MGLRSHSIQPKPHPHAPQVFALPDTSEVLEHHRVLQEVGINIMQSTASRWTRRFWRTGIVKTEHMSPAMRDIMEVVSRITYNPCGNSTLQNASRRGALVSGSRRPCAKSDEHQFLRYPVCKKTPCGTYCDVSQPRNQSRKRVGLGNTF